MTGSADGGDGREEAFAERLDAIGEELSDLALERLRATLDRGDTTRPADEKRLTQARRAVEKAAHLLRPRPDGRLTADRMGADLDLYEQTARCAFSQSGHGGRIVDVTEVSPMVSTNHVYRLDARGRAPPHGQGRLRTAPYWLFKEDHDRLHRCRQQLQDTRYANLLADTVTKDGRVVRHRDGPLWAALYEEVPKRRSLPRSSLPPTSRTWPRRWPASIRPVREIVRLVPPTSTSIKSDAIHLLDLVSDPATASRFPYDTAELAYLGRQCERFLTQLDALGYDDWVKIPVLIDWNLGNFSVDYHGDRFRLYSRWDYDWFRMDPRTLDFYFLSRVSSRTGDRTVFTYEPHTFVEPRFQCSSPPTTASTRCGRPTSCSSARCTASSSSTTSSVRATPSSGPTSPGASSARR